MYIYFYSLINKSHLTQQKPDVNKFLKNRATGHWIKLSSIVCSQNKDSTHLLSAFFSALRCVLFHILQGNKPWITDNIPLIPIGLLHITCQVDIT